MWHLLCISSLASRYPDDKDNVGSKASTEQ